MSSVVRLPTRASRFVRMMRYKALTPSGLEAAQMAEANRDPQIATAIRAAIGLTDDAGALMAAEQINAEFLDLVTPLSIAGKMNPRRIPFNTRYISVTAPPLAYWTSAGKAKPVTRMDLAGETLPPRKISSLVVETEELVRAQDPESEQYFRQNLTDAVVRLSDASLIDPANAGVTDEQPASLLYGVAPIASSGDCRTDLSALIAALSGNKTKAVWVTTPDLGAELQMCAGVGASEGGLRGGVLLGAPLLTSDAVPAGVLALIDSSAVVMAEGAVEFSQSREATIQMLDDPPASSAAPTGTTAVSLWQTNSIALLAERYANWKLGREGGAVWIEGAAYSAST